MTFYRTSIFLLNLLARLFGVLALLAGSSSLIAAYVIEADRWMYGVIGLLLIAIGVAVFMAKATEPNRNAPSRQIVDRTSGSLAERRHEHRPRGARLRTRTHRPQQRPRGPMQAGCPRAADLAEWEAPLQCEQQHRSATGESPWYINQIID